MAGLTFAFNSDTETPDTLEAKRAVAMALARGALAPARNAGEGLSKVGNALAYAMAMSNFANASQGAYKQLGDAMSGLMGAPGAPAAAAPTAPAAPAAPVPVTPSIPSDALTPGPMSDTPAPLSGGTLPQNSAALTDAVAKLESGNSPVNGPAGRYANYRFQQFPAFVKQYGSGEDGVVNYAKQVLAANPNATFGDMYGGYVTGTGNPATAAEASLQTTTQPGAKGAYANLVRNSPVDPKTPLAQLIASGIGSLLGPASANAEPLTSNATLMQPQGAVPLPQPRPDIASAPALPPPDQVASLGGAVPTSPAADPRQQIAQALMRGPAVGGFTPSQGPEPNITTLPVRSTTLPISDGRQAVAQALSAQAQTAPQAAPVSPQGNVGLGIPPQVAETIRKLSAIPLPQAQTMAAQLMQRYLTPRPYQLMQGADGTITAINPLNPRDNYVAAHVAAKPIAVAPGGTLVVPGATGQGQTQGGAAAGPSSAFNPVYQNTTGLFDKGTLTAMADQYLTGDKSVLQNLGRTAIGGMNMSALRERIVSRAKEMGISPTEISSRIGQFDSYTAAQKATGTRGGNVTMAATEAGNLGNLVLDTSAGVPRSNFPVWNKITNSYAENTGDPNIVKFTGALNSYINAYARAINPSGSTTVSDKEHAREILDTAMSHGQIQAGITQLQKELEQAKTAPASSSETIKREFMTRSNPRNSEALTQARDAIAQGAPKAAVIQRLQQLGVDPSGL